MKDNKVMPTTPQCVIIWICCVVTSSNAIKCKLMPQLRRFGSFVSTIFGIIIIIIVIITHYDIQVLMPNHECLHNFFVCYCCCCWRCFCCWPLVLDRTHSQLTLAWSYASNNKWTQTTKNKMTMFTNDGDGSEHFVAIQTRKHVIISSRPY